MIKWLPPIDPPKDPKLHEVWRMYELGRWMILRIHGHQIGNRP